MQLDHLSLAHWELFESPVEESRSLSKLNRQEIRLRRRLSVDLEIGLLPALGSSPVFSDEIHRDRHYPRA